MSKYRRLAKNTLLIFLGSAGAKLLNFLLLPFYTSWLSVEDFGITDLLNVYVVLLLGFCTASISEAAFVFPKSQKKEVQKEYFSSGLFYSGILLTIFVLLFQIIKYVFAYNDEANVFTENTWYIFAMVVAQFLQSYFQQFAKGIDKMKVYSATGIVLTVFTALASFIFIPVYGVYGYIISVIIAYFISSVYCLFFSGSHKYISFGAIKKEKYFEMLKYSTPLIPNSTMWWFIGYFNRPILEAKSGLESIGLLAVANKFPTLIVMLFAVFFHSWQVSVLEEFEKKDYQFFYNKIFGLMLFVLCSFSILLTFSAKFIVSLVTTTDFHKAWIYIPILVLAPLFQAISSFSSVNFSASKQTKYIFYASMFGAVVSIGLNFTLIPSFGIWGAVYAIVGAYISMTMARVYYAWKYVHITDVKERLITLFSPIIISLMIVNVDLIVVKSLVITMVLIVFFYINRNPILIGFDKIKQFYANYTTSGK